MLIDSDPPEIQKRTKHAVLEGHATWDWSPPAEVIITVSYFPSMSCYQIQIVAVAANITYLTAIFLPFGDPYDSSNRSHGNEGFSIGPHRTLEAAADHVARTCFGHWMRLDMPGWTATSAAGLHSRCV